ncbi:MAG: BatD family protein [Bacteroidota bacterium]
MKKFIFICLCVGFWGISWAQSPSFTVTVSTDSILMGNYFEVTFTLKDANGSNFLPPDFPDFQVVSGPNQSMSTSFINGQMSQSMSYTYYLEPKDLGNFYITAASISTAEEVLETEPKEIIVLANPDGIIQKPRRAERSRGFFDMFPSTPLEEMFPGGMPQPQDIPPMEQPQPQKQPKKKRKVYKL